jgi:hypothetical protein
MKSQPPSKLIFVVGVWRSGTSLLHAFLHNHPRIALLYEAEPLTLFPRATRAVWPHDWTTRLEFFNQTFSRHRLDAAALPGKKSARESMLGLFQTWAARKDAVVMGGKSPSYYRCLPAIARIFPEAEFIIIWRDPLEVCRSVVNAGKQNRFFSRKGILTQVFFGSEHMAQGVLELRAAGRRVHEVAYQELIGDPKSELEKICGFIGLEFDPRMLDLKSADCSMLPPGEHHTQVRSGVVKKTSAREEVLPAKFVAKATRYLALWQEKYPNLVFNRALIVPPEAGPPGGFERLADRGIYLGCSSLMDLKLLVFRLMPLSVWRRLRDKTKLNGATDSATSAKIPA